MKLKGLRVKYSPLGLERLRPRFILRNRKGTIAHQPRNPKIVSIKWDGTNSVTALRMDFLDFC